MADKVIGYRAPHDLWNKNIKKYTIFIPVPCTGEGDYGPIDDVNNAWFQLPAEIVETWEAVIEDTIYQVGQIVRWVGTWPATGVVLRYNGDKCYSLDIHGNTKSHSSCHINHLRAATDFEISEYNTIKVVLFGDVEFRIHANVGYAETDFGKVTYEVIRKAVEYIENPPNILGHKLNIHTENLRFDFSCVENTKDVRIGFGCKPGKYTELVEILNAFNRK